MHLQRSPQEVALVLSLFLYIIDSSSSMRVFTVGHCLSLGTVLRNGFVTMFSHFYSVMRFIMELVFDLFFDMSVLLC